MTYYSVCNKSNTKNGTCVAHEFAPGVFVFILVGFVLLLLSFRVQFRVVMFAMISSSIDFRFMLTSVLLYVLLTIYAYSVCNNSNTKGGTCGASEFFTT
jgi:hypothetical protein